MAKKKDSVVAKNATTEKEKEEWKPSGRKLEGEELKEHLKAFSDLEDSFQMLYKNKRGKND